MNYKELSKELSYALRHAPQEYGITLDGEGWADMAQLIEAINQKGGYERAITVDDIDYIIRNAKKARHEVCGGRIRACYGHSVEQKIEKTPAKAPDILYHATSHKAWEIIKTEGLKPMARQQAHLSADKEIALEAGRRKDRHPVLLEINASAMQSAGIVFYLGNGMIWLCDYVPPEYFRKIE